MKKDLLVLERYLQRTFMDKIHIIGILEIHFELHPERHQGACVVAGKLELNHGHIIHHQTLTSLAPKVNVSHWRHSFHCSTPPSTSYRLP